MFFCQKVWPATRSSNKNSLSRVFDVFDIYIYIYIYVYTSSLFVWYSRQLPTASANLIPDYFPGHLWRMTYPPESTQFPVIPPVIRLALSWAIPNLFAQSAILTGRVRKAVTARPLRHLTLSLGQQLRGESCQVQVKSRMNRHVLLMWIDMSHVNRHVSCE